MKTKLPDKAHQSDGGCLQPVVMRRLFLEKVAAKEAAAAAARTAAIRRKQLGPMQTEEGMRHDIQGIFADGVHARGVGSAATKIRIKEHGQDA